jgi:phosphoribosylglycinamide formyltransferase-1
MAKKKRAAFLISGSGTNLQSFIDDRSKNYEIACVGSSNPKAFGLTRASKACIPTFNLPYNEFSEFSRKQPGRLPLDLPADFDLKEILEKSKLADTEENRKLLQVRAIVEEILLRQLKKFEVDVLVLAGFMKLLSPYFLDRFQPNPFKPRVLNIHPSLLPSFPGEHAVKKALDYGVKVFGSTVHYVDYDTDTGPIIDQTSYKRMRGESIDAFEDRGLALEWMMFPNTVKMHCNDELKIIISPSGRRIVEEIPPKRFNPR